MYIKSASRNASKPKKYPIRLHEVAFSADVAARCLGGAGYSPMAACLHLFEVRVSPGPLHAMTFSYLNQTTYKTTARLTFSDKCDL